MNPKEGDQSVRRPSLPVELALLAAKKGWSHGDPPSTATEVLLVVLDKPPR